MRPGCTRCGSHAFEHTYASAGAADVLETRCLGCGHTRLEAPAVPPIVLWCALGSIALLVVLALACR